MRNAPRMHTTNPQRHIHLRKLATEQRLEAYPHPVAWKRWLDRAVYAAGILSPLMTIPQAMQVWETRDVTGLSLVTWGTYVVSSAVWTVYGIVHKERPIVLSNVLFFVLNGMITAGILLFR